MIMANRGRPVMLKGKRIFIVEDESTIRDLYKDMLGIQGYVVFGWNQRRSTALDNDSLTLLSVIWVCPV
jgi:DNA-binding response OmpR family regulator